MTHALRRIDGARFIVVGLAMTALHLAVFRLVVPWSIPEVANVVAFLVATQVNFACSYFWTWSSRRPIGHETVGYVLRRGVLFNGSALLGFGINAAVFSAAYRIAGAPPMVSAVVATAVSAAASFLISSRVVFARRPLLDLPEVPSAADALGRA
jgi:putative flippase GtrA